MDNKTIAAVLAVALIVAVGPSFSKDETAAPTINVAPPDITVNVPPQDGDVNVQVPETQTLGGASPDSPFTWSSVGGLREWSYGRSLAQGTTTACSILSPAATSTLNLGKTGIQFTTGSTSAITVILAKGATPNATTTQIGNDFTIAANAYGTFKASTTAAQQIAAADVIAPSTYLNFSVRGGDSGSNATGFVPVGKCNASFVEFK